MHELAITQGILAVAPAPPPPWIRIYGIVGRDFGFGEGLSLEVEAAARRLLGRLARLARRLPA